MPAPFELRRAEAKARAEQDKRNAAAEAEYEAQLTALEEAKRAQAAKDKAEHDASVEAARLALTGADEPDEAHEQKALGGAPENKSATPKSRKRHK